MASVPLILAEEDVELGGRKGMEGDFCYRNNVAGANIRIRLAFLRKVYSLLTVQLILTTFVGFLLQFWPKVRLFVQNNDWLLSLSIITSVVSLILLHWKRKDYPANLVLLGIFTLVEAYTVGVFVTFFEQFIVLQALVLTVAVVVGLTAFTFQTKRDFSFLGVFLFSALCTLLVAGFMQVIFNSNAAELILSIVGSFTFSLFIVYDTQKLMKQVSPEEYILATINLYLDIINLFIYILRALQASRRH